MTEAIYIEVKHKVDELNGKRHVSVSGMLRHLGVSRSGYNAWLVRQPSKQEQRKLFIIDKIQDIYDESRQNYGAPKITKKLISEGQNISERTVGKYMNELRIKPQYIKPYTITTRDPDFSSQLTNILDEKFNPERPDAVWCTDITYSTPS